ncbi:MAG: FAD-binding oxidoreductase, partial [Bacteroidota bacterium]
MFHTLSVKSIEKSTEDSSIVAFEVSPSLQPHFSFKAGQYLTLQAFIGGEEVRRSYSLCSSPNEYEWKVGVKKVPGGKFSTFVNEQLRVGDTLEVMAPEGRFHIAIDPERKRNYVAFAAGSGITPIISLIKSHLHSEPNSTFTLFFINQRVTSIMLKEELAGLKDLYVNRIEIFHFLTKEQRTIPLFNGRIDAEKLEIISKTICDISAVNHFFMCG